MIVASILIIPQSSNGDQPLLPQQSRTLPPLGGVSTFNVAKTRVAYGAGMMAVAVTPNMKLAAVCSAYFYSLFNLFAGFTITQPNMPGWWYASAHALTFNCHKSSFHKTLKLFIILFAMQHHACCI